MPSETFAAAMNHASKLRDFVFDLLFPIECMNCGQEADWLCAKCFKQLKFNCAFQCAGCHGPSRAGEYCLKCREDYALNGVWVGGDYENQMLKKLIKCYKYNFVSGLDKILGKFLSLYFLNLKNTFRLSSLRPSPQITGHDLRNIISSPQALLDTDNAIVMPVPLHKKRLMWRGFNQSALLAIILAKHFGLEYNDKSLIRKRYNKPQAKLNRNKRLGNIINNFIWRGNALANKNIILIDDVATTGATLNECAKTLKKAGANEVWGLVLAQN